MKYIRLGFPEFITTKHGEEYVVIPSSEMSGVMDIGLATAHELGYAEMGHRLPIQSSSQHILRELEAWYWAVTRRGLTKADKAYFWEEIVVDAEDSGIDREELARLLDKAIKNVEGKRLLR